MTSDSQLSQTASYWDEYVSQPELNQAEWMAHPLVQEHFNRVRGGLTLEDWFINKYLAGKSVRRALGIGAGVASFELYLMHRGLVEAYDLYDVSSVALARAEETARAYGVADRVRFYCQDLSQLELPAASYDLVTFISSLHHVTHMESTLHQMYNALVPGGLLFANEYIGPDRFAFPEVDCQVAQRLYRILDPALRSPWPELPLPNPQDVINADPTEAVHSSDIVAVLSRVFDTLEITPLKNALTFIIWWGLNHKALFETEQGFDLVRHILDIEAALITTGRLPNYFSYLAARKRS